MELDFPHGRDKQLEIMKEVTTDIKSLKTQIEQERVGLYIKRNNFTSATSASEIASTFTSAAMGTELFDIELHDKERTEIQRKLRQQAPINVHLIGDFNI